MSDLSDPHRPSSLPLAPTTSRWEARRLGVLVIAGVALLLAWGAWHYTHRVPSVPSNNAPVPARGLR